ncbi:hypothetical protein APS_1211 [Acetobacter pasteurianus subsp. pasteurianus LMG 1262 = NBRC 106471]|nr:hypothetical protein APS_1211 [Acetobacter pasteurianus subsp. pasteurianus LMG 1262 = NBRC 106471]
MACAIGKRVWNEILLLKRVRKGPKDLHTVQESAKETEMAL